MLTRIYLCYHNNVYVVLVLFYCVLCEKSTVCSARQIILLLYLPQYDIVETGGVPQDTDMVPAPLPAEPRAHSNI